jgi:hypothetical protein
MQRVTYLVLIGFFSSIFVVAQSSSQNCVTGVIIAQIESLDKPDMSAIVPLVVKENMYLCVDSWLMLAALSLSASTVTAVVLGATFSNQSLARPSTHLSARYEPDTRKLVLQFDRPVIVRNPQRMVLLYHHADGMATTVPGQRCWDGGLTLAFTTNIEKSPTYMELIVYSGAMHPAGFPESDVCTGGRPLHIDVDILPCDTK